MPKSIMYKKVLSIFIIASSIEKRLWSVHWFWFKHYEKIRNLTAGQSPIIKNHYRLIAVDLSRRKK